MDFPDKEMLDIKVSLKKDKYGELGNLDYRKNCAMATTPLSKKFSVARHKIVLDAEKGDQSKYSPIHSIIVSILHCIKQGKA